MHSDNLISPCPVCSTTNTRVVMKVRDTAVSGEVFQLADCSACELRYTHDAPCATAIGKYYQSADYISHQDEGKDVIGKLYMLARRFTLQQKRKRIEKMTRKISGSLLDIGAGTGSFLHTMQQSGWKVVGLEPAAAARNVALDLFQLSLKDTAELFNLPEQSFDVITMWHVLEHVHDLHGYLSQIRKLLKPDGKLLIAVPNVESHDATYYGEHWAAYDVPRHLYHFSAASMKHLLQRNGLAVLYTQPMWLDAFYISIMSERYRGGSMVSALVEGLRSNIKAFAARGNTSSLTYVVGHSHR